MLDLMYDLPDQKQEGATYEVSGELVDSAIAGTRPSLFSALKHDEAEAKKESA
jgi:hypothetical protein